LSLQVGDVIRTSYGTGPYRVVEILRGCTCPSYLNQIERDDEAPASRPHVHMECRLVGREKEGPFTVSGYDDETLKSVWNGDRIEIVGQATTQLNLFDAAGVRP